MAEKGMVLRGGSKSPAKKSKAAGAGAVAPSRRKRRRGAGALGMSGGTGGALKRLGIVGGSALVVKYVSDGLVERLFEDEADPKMQAVYRGGVQMVGAGAIGYYLWKRGYREIGAGVALGGVVGGGMRIAEAYDWDTSLHDLFTPSETTTTTTTTGTPGATGLYLGSGSGRTYNGTPVRTGARTNG